MDLKKGTYEALWETGIAQYRKISGGATMQSQEVDLQMEEKIIEQPPEEIQPPEPQGPQEPKEPSDATPPADNSPQQN